jgi:hypothetical protein
MSQLSNKMLDINLTRDLRILHAEQAKATRRLFGAGSDAFALCG